MTPPYAKALPVPDPITQGFWDGCRAHELRIQRCNACGTYIHFPAPMCHNCDSMNLGWSKVSGRGTVFSFIIIHQPTIQGFAQDVPYVFAWVELDEQQHLKMPTTIIGCSPREVRIGMRVEVTFEDVTDQITLPKFRPLG